MTFAVFDIETRVDKRLLKQVFFDGEELADEDAYRRFRDALRDRGNDFFPLTLHVPISIAIGDVGDDYALRSVGNLALEDYSEERLAREFWRRMERFSGCMVSFNGRRFDLPVLELAAMRHAIPAPSYFGAADSPRGRYSAERHLDLCDFLSNYGAVGLRGGMDLLLKMIGLPGKTGFSGAMVQDYFDAGRLDEIHRYCRSDVIQTYFLFLRVQLMRGRIGEAAYRTAWTASERFLPELRQASESSVDAS